MAEFVPERSKDLRNYCIMPIAATIDDRLKGTAAFTLLARICTYTDNVGVTYVSQDRLAADLKVSRQAINKQMKRLRDLGYIVYARKRYATQKTTSIKVIYGDVKKEDEAYSNLTPLQQMEQAEQQALARLRNHVKPPEVAGDMKLPEVAGDKTGETQLGLHQVKPSEVAGPETPRGCTKRTIERTNNVYKENIKQMMNEFCKHADQFGTPRILNERDTALMTSWIDNGLTMITWRSILGKHVYHCKQNNREIARSLGYFVEPVKRELSKLGSPQLKAMVNQLVRDKKM
jgi:DNA-binding Lrp family transcriptional regulator